VAGPSTLYLGLAQQFTAAAIDARGDTLRGRVIRWGSSDSAVALVDSTGIVTGLVVGSATISATVDGKTGSKALAVILAPVHIVQVTPQRDSFFVDDSLQMVATLLDDGGRVLTGRVISWVSSDTTVAVVSTTGLVKARVAGSVAVTATSEGKVAGAFLMAQQRAVALNLPDSLTLHRSERVLLIPSLRSALGTHLAGRPIAWTTLDSTVFVVDTLGVITPQGIGTARLTASSSGLADTTVIHVIPNLVFAVTTPWLGDGDGRLFVGRPEEITARPVDERSSDVIGAEIVWTSGDTAVAVVVPDTTDSWRATVTAVSRGPVSITASSGGKENSTSAQAEFWITTWRFGDDSLFIPVGTSRPLVAVGLDTLGNGLAVAPVTPTIMLDSGIVAASGGGNSWVLGGLQPGRARISGLAYDQYPMNDTITVIVVPKGPDRLVWEVNDRLLPTYYTAWVGLALRDSVGQPAAANRTVIVTSSDTAIVALDDTLYTDVNQGVLVPIHARARGAVQLTARTDSLYASLPVVVVEVLPYQITLSLYADTLAEGDTVRFGATTRGTDGNVHDYPVSWSTSDSTIASVSATGLVTAVAGGRATITATTGTVSRSAQLWIQSLAAPTIMSVTPGTLTPGTVATIAGSGFDPDPAADLVSVDGVPLTVNAASDTLLTVTLPPYSGFPCDSTHGAELTLASGGRYTFGQTRLAPAPPLQFVASGPRQVTRDEARCFRLVLSGATRLLVSIVNTASSADSAGTVRLSYVASAAAAAAPRPGPPAPSMPAGPPPEIRVRADSARLVAQRHRRVLEGNREFMNRVGPPAPLLRMARGLKPQLSVSARVGDLVAIRVPRINYPDFCSRYTTVTGRLVYSGQHVIMFEDVNAPLARAMDNSFTTVGPQVDNLMWNVVQANFGNPLALDSLLDRNARVAILFSPMVNNFGVGGFVTSCDFYPETAAPSSNTGEIIYSPVPTAFGQGFQDYTPQVWRWLIPTTLVHELKHVAAFAERFSRGAPPEDTWLEEATAVVSQELWARATYGTTWKGEATYPATLYCDVRPTWPQCLGRPNAMFDVFALLYEFGARHESRTPLGPMAYDDATFYGSGWSLVRWTIDAYATSEPDFLRTLTAEPNLVGVANLAARAGHPFADLATNWSLALRVDGAIQPGAPQFASWDLSSIFLGMAQDFPSDFQTNQPFVERGLYFVGGGSANITMPGGAFTLFRYDFPPPNQVIQIFGPTGGLVSDKLVVQLMRFP
jgi:uncharacterized protein YjdB